MAPPRILLCGDVLGRLNQLFKRVLTVNKSAGPFDALFCVGQFFPESFEQIEEFTGYMEGKSEIPIPTYFIGDYGVGASKVLAAAAKAPGNQGFKMDGLKVCDNLYWLKGSGKFTLHGLCVTYLSGRQSSSGQQFGTYSQDDVDSLRALAEEPGIVDLFLTSEWPTGVTNMASTSEGISDSTGSDSIIAELVTEIKPRYHIAGSKGVFYSREPYTNDEAVHVTRFIGLAQVGNKNKQKFMHALSPTPASTMSAAEISARPPNTTPSPFKLDEKPTSVTVDSAKRSLDSSLEEQYWRYDVKKQRLGEGKGDNLCFKFLSSGECPWEEKCHFRHDADAREQYMRGVCFGFLSKGKCERGPECQFKHNLVEEGESAPNRRRRHEGANPSRSRECWFCLSSLNVETHLIISLGESFYYALPKGPLVDDHVLIVPIEHFTSTLSTPSDCEEELYRFQSSLRSYSKEQGKEMIFFELVSKRGTHANLQAIPVPPSKGSAVKNIFNLAAKKLGFEFKTSNGDIRLERKLLSSQVDSSSAGVFYVELPDGTMLSHALTENSNFPVQFGREVLAGLLKMPEKADWRNCKLSKDEEVIMVETFKERFKRFDPNQ